MCDFLSDWVMAIIMTSINVAICCVYIYMYAQDKKSIWKGRSK